MENQWTDHFADTIYACVKYWMWKHPDLVDTGVWAQCEIILKDCKEIHERTYARQVYRQNMR